MKKVDILNKLKEVSLDILFPKFCVGCQKEGTYLCQDCKACLDISEYNFCLCKKPKIIPRPGKCPYCQNTLLDGLFFAVPLQNFLIKRLIREFKENYVRDISTILADLIISHFLLLDQEDFWEEKVLFPIPSEKTKQRGFNPSEEIAKHLSKRFNVPIITSSQIKNNEKIILIDVSYRTGETLNKTAKTLKEAGVKEIWGVVAARGN